MNAARSCARSSRAETAGSPAAMRLSSRGGARWLAVAALLACSRAVLASAEPPAVPDKPAAQAAPPPRPSSDGAQEPARSLFQAIVEDRPELAEAFFFPRDAFVLVKAMARPERYWDRLHARFVADIHALHQRTPELARASFVRLELTPRGGYVAPGEEGNKLPYWAARHAFLHYRVGAQRRKLEVRVLITWRDTWYVIHLNEFR